MEVTGWPPLNLEINSGAGVMSHIHTVDVMRKDSDYWTTE